MRKDEARVLDRNLELNRAARKLGASPADLPGLWNVPGHPELTNGQLLDLAGRTA